MADWHVGQKVVCVNGDFPCRTIWQAIRLYLKPKKDPVVNGIYTISEINDEFGSLWFSFYEFDHEWEYESGSFRPIVYNTVDISILTPIFSTCFTSILNSVNKREVAGVIL